MCFIKLLWVGRYLGSFYLVMYQENFGHCVLTRQNLEICFCYRGARGYRDDPSLLPPIVVSLVFLAPLFGAKVEVWVLDDVAV